MSLSRLCPLSTGALSLSHNSLHSFVSLVSHSFFFLSSSSFLLTPPSQLSAFPFLFLPPLSFLYPSLFCFFHSFTLLSPLLSLPTSFIDFPGRSLHSFTTALESALFVYILGLSSSLRSFIVLTIPLKISTLSRRFRDSFDYYKLLVQLSF